jgi:hypothetical protein
MSIPLHSTLIRNIRSTTMTISFHSTLNVSFSILVQKIHNWKTFYQIKRSYQYEHVHWCYWPPANIERPPLKKLKTFYCDCSVNTSYFGLSSQTGQYYHLINADAHVNPLPNAARHNRSPDLTLPSSHASVNAMGIEAAVVLPNRCRLLMTCDSSSPI